MIEKRFRNSPTTPNPEDAARYGTVKPKTKVEVKYPFEKWLSKPVTVLKKYVDYCESSSRLVLIIRTYASKHDMEVNFRFRDHAISITQWDHIQPDKSCLSAEKKRNKAGTFKV